MSEIKKSIYISIGLLSTGVIAFEIILIQIFSITQWYHFAYMVISVAMLGFGMAGTILTLYEEWFLKRFNKLFPLLLFLTGICMALVVSISNGSAVRFDTYLVFTDFRQIGRLILTYLLFFIPFFLAALAIGLAFVGYIQKIGILYAVDLIGSSVGALLGVILMWFFFPWEIPGLVALLPLAAGIFFLERTSGNMMKLIALITLLVIGWSISNPARLELSEFKNISKTLLLPDAKIEIEKNSPYGLIQVVSSPVLRQATGLSINYRNNIPVRKALFNNGDWIGSVVSHADNDSVQIIDFSTAALPYILRTPKQVLILDAGTGEQVAYALAKGVHKARISEANPMLLSLLQNELALETDSLFYQPTLDIHNLEARTLLYNDTNHYDLISLPMVSSFGGTAGLNALHEQYLLTEESFQLMWEKLNPDGMISISTWIDYPVNNPLKILATLVETLEGQGINQYSQHLAVIRSWGTITFLLKKSTLSDQDINRVRNFCDKLSFDLVILTGLKKEELQQYNQLQDTLIFSYINAILSPDREAFYESYDFNIRPATDQRPYFSQFIQWKSLSNLFDTFTLQRLPFLEIGYFIVVLTFFQIMLIALVMIIIPLFKLGIGKWIKWRILLYFGGIGIGYMFVEIVLIQRFLLYFGNPIYATAAVISSLLIASGLGSYFSSRLMIKGFKIWAAPILIIVYLMLIALIINPILLSTIAWPLLSKIIILLILVIPLGFTMGIPFPTGLKQFSKKGKGSVPWAWGINGYFSVISTAVATIIAVEFGFIWVIAGAMIGYLLPVLTSWSIR